MFEELSGRVARVDVCNLVRNACRCFCFYLRDVGSGLAGGHTHASKVQAYCTVESSPLCLVCVTCIKLSLEQMML
jgi:hypothetical protein